MECEHARTAFATQMLGGLDGPQRECVAEHLDRCPSCRAERDELLALLPLLDAVRPYELEGVPAPDPERAVRAARELVTDRD
ncbi:zf-HC2 domain-containing protein [Streptomyces erythrochromogenes]|uniref:zf-HC2 domain-containing protein n=1 Tax=Streptomyces erythrochromogenes TaxID=285574 RepID=UPI000ACA999A